MTTLFSASLGVLGLSQREAGEYLGYSLETIKKYCQGKREPREEAWAKLRALYAMQETAKDNTIEVIGDMKAEALNLNTSPKAAKGWPCHSAYMAALARVALESDLPVVRVSG